MMKRTLKYALLLTSMTLLSVLTKNGYTSCNFGVFNEPIRETRSYFNNAADEKIIFQDQVDISVAIRGPISVFTDDISYIDDGSSNCNIAITPSCSHLSDCLIPGIFWGAGNYATFVTANDTNRASQSIRSQLRYSKPDIMKVVPEPEAHAILLLGVGLLGASARRRHKPMNS